jgi:hypothetical protein
MTWASVSSTKRWLYMPLYFLVTHTVDQIAALAIGASFNRFLAANLKTGGLVRRNVDHVHGIIPLLVANNHGSSAPNHVSHGFAS